MAIGRGGMCIVHALPSEMKSWKRAGRCASWSLYCFFDDRSASKRTRAAGGLMGARGGPLHLLGDRPGQSGVCAAHGFFQSREAKSSCRRAEGVVGHVWFVVVVVSLGAPTSTT